jgi:hypothetical protein
MLMKRRRVRRAELGKVRERAHREREREREYQK